MFILYSIVYCDLLFGPERRRGQTFGRQYHLVQGWVTLSVSKSKGPDKVPVFDSLTRYPLQEIEAEIILHRLS